jgi:hypothetical protein
MIIVCWNIKAFGAHALQSPRKWTLLQTIFSQADVVFILEGPKAAATSNQAANRLGNQMGGQWQAASIHTPAPGNENEYVIYAWDGHYINGVVPNVVYAQQAAGHRPPVAFTINGILHQAGGVGNVNVLVWHAPPIDQNPGQLWTGLRSQLNNNANYDLLMGDFNSTPTAPLGYTDVPQQALNGGTMIHDPRTHRITEPDEGVGGSANDRIFIRNGFVYGAAYLCGVKNPLEAIVGEDILSPVPGTGRAKRKRPSIDLMDGHQIAWETSNHAPMYVVV